MRRTSLLYVAAELAAHHCAAGSTCAERLLSMHQCESKRVRSVLDSSGDIPPANCKAHRAACISNARKASAFGHAAERSERRGVPMTVMRGHAGDMPCKHASQMHALQAPAPASLFTCTGSSQIHNRALLNSACTLSGTCLIHVPSNGRPSSMSSHHSANADVARHLAWNVAPRDCAQATRSHDGGAIPNSVLMVDPRQLHQLV